MKKLILVLVAILIIDIIVIGLTGRLKSINQKLAAEDQRLDKQIIELKSENECIKRLGMALWK